MIYGDDFNLYDKFHQGHETYKKYRFNRSEIYLHHDEGFNLSDLSKK